MIIVKLSGGLGNQMFQYAIGRNLAHRNESELLLDINTLKCADPDQKFFTNRDYFLNNFNIIATIASNRKLKRIHYRKKLTSFLFKEFSFLKEANYYFEPSILNYTGNIYLSGYWQSEKYFVDIRSIIIHDFQINTPLIAKNRIYAEQILNTKSVSIHIRRGDYVSNPIFAEVYGTCSLDYYNAAINFYMSNFENPFFYVFSDDISWVKANLKLKENFVFIENNTEGNCIEDLRLMALCEHNIIANSSFSWWGAWLNSNPNKIVHVPEKWFKDPTLDAKDMIPDSWIKVRV